MTSPVRTSSAPVPGTLTVSLALAIVTALATVSLIVKLPPVVARILGIAATLAGVGSFVPIATIRAAQGGAGGLAQGISCCWGPRCWEPSGWG